MAGGEGASPAEKGNEYAIEALKQLLTLSTLVLGVTIAFLKDALGDARSDACFTWLVPFGWALLLLSIWTAWVGMAHAAKTIATKPPAYVFKAGMARQLARCAQWSFLLGLTSIGAFAILNAGLIFRGPKA